MMDSIRIELTTLQTPDLHAVMALPGILEVKRDERQIANSLLTIRIASSI